MSEVWCSFRSNYITFKLINISIIGYEKRTNHVYRVIITLSPRYTTRHLLGPPRSLKSNLILLPPSQIHQSPVQHLFITTDIAHLHLTQTRRKDISTFYYVIWILILADKIFFIIKYKYRHVIVKGQGRTNTSPVWSFNLTYATVSDDDVGVRNTKISTVIKTIKRSTKIK